MRSAGRAAAWPRCWALEISAGDELILADNAGTVADTDGGQGGAGHRRALPRPRAQRRRDGSPAANGSSSSTPIASAARAARRVLRRARGRPTSARWRARWCRRRARATLAGALRRRAQLPRPAGPPLPPLSSARGGGQSDGPARRVRAGGRISGGRPRRRGHRLQLASAARRLATGAALRGGRFSTPTAPPWASCAASGEATRRAAPGWPAATAASAPEPAVRRASQTRPASSWPPPWRPAPPARHCPGLRRPRLRSLTAATGPSRPGSLPGARRAARGRGARRICAVQPPRRRDGRRSGRPRSCSWPIAFRLAAIRWRSSPARSTAPGSRRRPGRRVVELELARSLDIAYREDDGSGARIRRAA